MSSRPKLAVRAALVAAVVILLAIVFTLNSRKGHKLPSRIVRVLSYSAFMNAWGPAGEIARAFEKETGMGIEFIDAGDAGLLLRKLELFPSDLVIGLDQLSLAQARAVAKWRPLAPPEVPKGSLAQQEPDFLAFDYAPLSFVYREGEIQPPHALDELLSPLYRNAIVIEDPRQSTTGLQFFFWVLDEKGIDGGFEFFRALKPNLRAVTPSWSTAYGMFTKHEAKLALSYLTSPVYHVINEGNGSYRAAIFPTHPSQIEYMGVPANCKDCEAGEALARFLLRRDIQHVIMMKNYMLPVVREMTANTPFQMLPPVPERPWRQLPELLKRRDELFDRWRQLGL